MGNLPMTLNEVFNFKWRGSDVGYIRQHFNNRPIPAEENSFCYQKEGKTNNKILIYEKFLTHTSFYSKYSLSVKMFD